MSWQEMTLVIASLIFLIIIWRYYALKDKPTVNGETKETSDFTKLAGKSVLEIIFLFIGSIALLGWILPEAITHSVKGISQEWALFWSGPAYLLSVCAGYYFAFSHWPVAEKHKGVISLAVLCMMIALIQIWFLRPEPTFGDNQTKQKQWSQPFIFNEKEKISTISVPDETTVQFNSDKAFFIVERCGINDDGSYQLNKINMPAGNSQRYFTWGGTVDVLGKYNNTNLKVLY